MSKPKYSCHIVRFKSSRPSEDRGNADMLAKEINRHATQGWTLHSVTPISRGGTIGGETSYGSFVLTFYKD